MAESSPLTNGLIHYRYIAALEEPGNATIGAIRSGDVRAIISIPDNALASRYGRRYLVAGMTVIGVFQ
jgi:hypothetical protein